MKLAHAHIAGFRAIGTLDLPLDQQLTMLHGLNGQGKTSVLSAIALGLGLVPLSLGAREVRPFQRSDLRTGEGSAQVRLTDSDGVNWERRTKATPGKSPRLGDVRIMDDLRRHLGAAIYGIGAGSLPLVALYDTERAVVTSAAKAWRGVGGASDRLAAYDGALEARPDFRALVEWFYATENDELREQRALGNFEFQDPGLAAVCYAVMRMLPDVRRPRIEPPMRLVVTRHGPDGEQNLSLDQLSGGYRIVLAMAADLARRMVQANPDVPDPLASEAVVLIDEVELHLHPAWQQRVLGDLMRTFPNAQFIVSTHSPQVLTTVEPYRIVHLRAGPYGVEAERETAPTFGAEAGDVLTAAMDVPERPPNNPFVEKLTAYRRLIDSDQAEAPQAKALRTELEDLSPEDPALAAADVDIRRSKLLRDLARRA